MSIFSCHLLMCEPDHYGIHYEINPYMNKRNESDVSKSRNQWLYLHHTLIRCGAWVDYVGAKAGNPDMVFTANAGLFHNNRLVLSNFAHQERRGEEPHFEEYFKGRYPILKLRKGIFFEGAGDALFEGHRLFAGWGMRSTRSSYEIVADFLDVESVVYCQLISERFYHLDTCFCPLGNGKALVHPDAFTKDSMKDIEKNIEVLPVDSVEASNFACNAVVVGEHVVLPSYCPKTEKMLRNYGMVPHHCDMSEFLKAGGACKCLTLRIE